MAHTIVHAYTTMLIRDWDTECVSITRQTLCDYDLVAPSKFIFCKELAIVTATTSQHVV